MKKYVIVGYFKQKQEFDEAITLVAGKGNTWKICSRKI